MRIRRGVVALLFLALCAGACRSGPVGAPHPLAPTLMVFRDLERDFGMPGPSQLPGNEVDDSWQLTRPTEPPVPFDPSAPRRTFK